MVLNGMLMCDFCGRAAFPDDHTTLTMKDIKGNPCPFTYHNTIQDPCLPKLIQLLQSADFLEESTHAPHA